MSDRLGGHQRGGSKKMTPMNKATGVNLRKVRPLTAQTTGAESNETKMSHRWRQRALL
jgi:hypothetical protein